MITATIDNQFTVRLLSKLLEPDLDSAPTLLSDYLIECCADGYKASNLKEALESMSPQEIADANLLDNLLGSLLLDEDSVTLHATKEPYTIQKSNDAWVVRHAAGEQKAATLTSALNLAAQMIGAEISLQNQTEKVSDYVTIDDGKTFYPCKLGDTKWNGWDTPSFLSDSAIAIMKNHDSSLTGEEYNPTFYIQKENAPHPIALKDWLDNPENTALEAADIVLIVDPHYDLDDAEVYTSQIIDGKPHWSIGAFSWCWVANEIDVMPEYSALTNNPSPG